MHDNLKSKLRLDQRLKENRITTMQFNNLTYTLQLSMQTQKQRSNPLNRNLIGALLIVLATCFGAKLNAQQASAFDAHLESLDTSAREQLHALAYDEQATALATAAGISVVGNGAAQVLDVNASDLAALNFSDAALSQVKFIRIRINSASDLALNLNLSGSAALSQLSCVLVMSAVDASAAQITDSVQGAPTGVALCYSVSVPN
jgi:hypothetical protein